MATVERVCPECDQPYQADPARLKHGRQTTCSRACSYAIRGRAMGAANVGRRPVNGFEKGHRPWNQAEPFAIITCQSCGDPVEVRERARVGRTKFCSKACFYAGRTLRATFQGGSAHPAWIDGQAGNGYPPEFNPRLKRRIRERDGFACQLCTMTEAEHLARYGRVLCVNHIDFDKTNCDEDNLNTLCTGCNTRINWDRPYWTAFFREQMRTAA